MFKSVSGLPSFKRDIVVGALGPVVVDVLALASVARQAHVNVRGPHFVALHGLFGDLYDACNKQADSLAEYGAILGAPMALDHKAVAASSLGGLPVDTTDGIALCAPIVSAIQVVKGKLDAACRTVSSVDKGAEQLLIDASLALGKLGWMFGAHVPEVEGASG